MRFLALTVVLALASSRQLQAQYELKTSQCLGRSDDERSACVAVAASMDKLRVAQDSTFLRTGHYATELDSLPRFAADSGVTVRLETADSTGWAASLFRVGIPRQFIEVRRTDRSSSQRPRPATLAHGLSPHNEQLLLAARPSRWVERLAGSV